MYNYFPLSVIMLIAGNNTNADEEMMSELWIIQIMQYYTDY